MRPLVFAVILGTCLATTGHAADFMVTHTGDSGAGSLRQAILDANAAPGVDGITFSVLPGPGVHTILPLSPLPTITGPVTIDGSSAPNYAGSPVIEINGTLAGAGAIGLELVDSASQVGWLTINGFDSHGIRIAGTGGVKVVGCWIGLDETGVGAAPNGGEGILIDSAPGNTIGGQDVFQRNVVSGNAGSGIRIQGGASTGNVVLGNYVGTDATGMSAVGNDFGIVCRSGADSNTIGTSAAPNVVAGSEFFNILLVDCGSDGVVVSHNLVGLNASATDVVGGRDGIDITQSPNCHIVSNQIAGPGVGITVATGSGGTVLEDNSLGINAAGTVIFDGYGSDGIRLSNVCAIRVEGNTVVARNQHGVVVTGSAAWTCGSSMRNVIVNNAIGGPGPRGNASSGIAIRRRGGVLVEGNTVSGNSGPGIMLNGTGLTEAPVGSVEITQNVIHDNGGLGIDLSVLGFDPDGVTPNDSGDIDTGPNDLQNAPSLGAALYDGASDMLTLSGTIASIAGITYRIEYFLTPGPFDPTDAEGATMVGTTSVAQVGASAPLATAFPGAGVTSYDQQVTATATNLTTGETSEFSNVIPVSAVACTNTGTQCYATSTTPGCSTGCCDRICDVDPFCCDGSWDALCVDQALQICGDCGTVAAGDPYSSNGSPGSWDSDCCALTCEADPYCCDTAWDQFCANTAISICVETCPSDIPGVSPGVVDVADLLALLAAWGTSGPPRPPADIAPAPFGDHAVNVTDLLALLGDWGTCP